MEQNNQLFISYPLRLSLTRGHNCSYLDGQIEQRIATDISDHPHAHDRLAETGFRRIENWVYRPACPHCSACKPIRVVADAFKPSRTQQRILKANQDVCITDAGTATSLEQYALFQHYLSARHEDGQMAGMSMDEFDAMISNSPISTRLLEFRSTRDNELLGCMLTDVQRDGLSAVYSFFTPEQPKRSLGAFMIMQLIESAKAAQLPYLYLGYYIRQSPKMSYKTNYRPYQIFEHGKWQTVSAAKE